jgi:DNA-binding GntR family transcriptional regulator
MTKASSLRERAAVAIRAAVITGEIQEGEIYSAPAIAQRLGVSATPVREAMLDLANEGLVEPVRNRGFRLVPFTDRDLDEIFEIRLMLEVPAMVAIAGKPELLTVARVRRLWAMVDDLEAYGEAGDVAQLIDADRKFHSELLQLFENRRLVELVERLRGYTRRYGMRRLDHKELFMVAADHRRILDALIEGDKEKVRRLMEQHLAANRGILAGRDEEPEGDSAEAAKREVLTAP